MQRDRILVIDDEQSIRDILVDFLSLEGFEVEAVGDAPTALALLAERSFDLVLTDMKLPHMDGLELLKRVREAYPEMIMLLMTGYGTIETAIEAMKRGAYDYVLKPFKVPELVFTIRRGLERQRLQQQNEQLNELVALYHVNERINTSTSTAAILDIFLGSALEHLQAEQAALYLRGVDGRFALQGSRQREEEAQPWPELCLEVLLDDFNHRRCILVSPPPTERLDRYLRVPEGEGLSSFVAVPMLTKNQVVGFIAGLNRAAERRFTERQRKALYILASKVAHALENARLNENLERSFNETMQSFAVAMEQKDKYTQGHSERVATYATLICGRLGLSEEDTARIHRAALLHDIGKLGIDTKKINKTGKLSREETEMFKLHPEYGRKILEPISSLAELSLVIYYHHEHFDGTGYPEGLAGEAIPLGSRILAVADSFDAMTSDRSYRKALSHDDAVLELRKNRGKQFDATIVEAFFSLLTEVGTERLVEHLAKHGTTMPTSELAPWIEGTPPNRRS